MPRAPRTHDAGLPSRQRRGTRHRTDRRARSPRMGRSTRWVSRDRTMDPISATMRRTSCGSARPATAPTCGKRAHRAQRSAAEVQAVELHLPRIVGGRQRRDQRAQCRRLARSGCADDRHIACGSGQVDHQAACGIARMGGRRRRWVRSGRASAGSASRSRVSSAGAAPSGGSQTWCAGGPCPASRSRTACRTVRVTEAPDKARVTGPAARVLNNPHRRRRQRRHTSRRLRRRRSRNECGLKADRLAAARAQETRAGRIRQLDCVKRSQNRRVIRRQTGSSGRSDRRGGLPVPAAGPRRAADWPATGACPATGRAGRSRRTCRRNQGAG